MSKKLILVIEDEFAIRSMLRFALERAQFEVLEAEDTSYADEHIGKRIPDLILLDWMLPGVSGEVYIKKLRANKLTHHIPIIMLTAKAEEEHRIRGLDVGADDYMIKPFSPKELVARIRAILRRGPIQQEDDVIQLRDISIDLNSKQVTVARKMLKLSRLEYRLLVFFMTHRKRIYSRSELLGFVWSANSQVDERTVDVQIRRLRNRLKESNNDDLIQTIHGVGYRFSESADG